MSFLSNATTNVTWEISDSNSSSLPFNNNIRQNSNISGSRFKGIVGQQNGHWGAQIYANHHRIWLGTFKSEKEAAMAYDSAAIKLRNGDSYRNFPWTNINVQEPHFQSQFSTEAVLNMIKNGSYTYKFADYLRAKFQQCGIEESHNMATLCDNKEFLCRPLFQKELTPSDVGKLNRLVIPKKFAVKYFPCISGNTQDRGSGGTVDDMQLFFFDKMMRSWKFRYCYWKSSQSYVFTRGWNRFVKEKGLKSKDTVTFSLCECRDASNQVQTFCMIDVTYSSHLESSGGIVENSDKGGEAMELKLNMVDDENKLKQEYERVRCCQNLVNIKNEMVTEEERDFLRVGATDTKNGFWLFGVQITRQGDVV
uniref:Transcription factor RAV1 n=1 Tax=Nothapodytes nimmoniana TaxID=159386 RepID=A0A9E9C2I3_NOTNI|nr:transcription factor RAV1 [Nothapodytes nimmoniana]